LTKNTSQRLGMIVSDIENPFFPEVIKSFEMRAQETGYDAIQSETGYDTGLMAGAAGRMLQQRVLGVSFVTS
jgi:LacI family transcriptional regulator